MITRIVPDTNAVAVHRRTMRIDFDEVVSERPAAAGASKLQDLVLVSPRSGAPSVDWGRDHITIRPRHGWRANTAYTVTLLPGVADLRGNVRTMSTVVTFSTGAAIPATAVRGRVFGALTGAPAANAVVEAHPVGDTTLVFVGVTDSLGGFGLRGLAPGSYAVRGYIDQNRNRGLDPGEPFDTTSLALRDTATLELLPFVHDSTGPRLTAVTAVDSVTLHATFDSPLAPTQPLDARHLALRGPGAAPVPLRGAVGLPDTAGRAAVAPGNVAGRGAPRGASRTAGRGAPLRPTRPLLFTTVRVTLGAPLRRGTTYRLRAVDIAGATGRTATSERDFTAPRPAPRAPRDSTARRP